MIAALSTVFGALAALLACIGLYGAMAYGVAGRTSELGIRIAVGAQQGDVVWLILKETMQLVAAGGCAGLAAALVLTRFVSSMLYGVTANDPVVFGGAAMVLAAVALLAGFLPARRASRIDPTMALRHE
jgi:ABC-type antimicrobial peptide transport system permease subunit